VQRVAREITRALDKLIHDGAIDADITLLCPPNCNPAEFGLKHIRVREVGRLTGANWEQFVLPFHVGDATLLCLGNTAPVIRLMTRRPTAVMVHDLSYRQFPLAYKARYRWAHRAILPLIMQRASRIILVSNTERERMLKLKPALVQRILVAPNGSWTDDAVADTPNSRPDLPANFALYVGSLSRRKNVDRLVRAAITVVREDGLSFVFVGSSGQVLTAPKFDIPEDVRHLLHFVGQVDDSAALAQLYKSARLLVFPSLYEASPLPPFEAAWFDCPVVASNIPSMWERCDEAVTYCDPRSEKSIVKAIRRVLTNDDERERKVAIHRARAEAASWRAQALSIITDLLGPAIHPARPVPARRPDYSNDPIATADAYQGG
jgi:glycosyltransferase involved in cell wall biosynthesis